MCRNLHGKIYYSEWSYEKFQLHNICNVVSLENEIIAEKLFIDSEIFCWIRSNKA